MDAPSSGAHARILPGDVAEGERVIAEQHALWRAQWRERAAEAKAEAEAEALGVPERASRRQYEWAEWQCTRCAEALVMAGDEAEAKEAMAEAARWSRAIAARVASEGGTPEERRTAQEAAAACTRRVEDAEEWAAWRDEVPSRQIKGRLDRSSALHAASFACFRDGNVAGGRRVVLEARKATPGAVADAARYPDTEAFWERWVSEARARGIEGHDGWGEITPARPDDAAWARACDPAAAHVRRDMLSIKERAQRGLARDLPPAQTVGAVQQMTWAFCANPDTAVTLDDDGWPRGRRDPFGTGEPLCCVVEVTQETMTAWIAHLDSVGVATHTPAWLDHEPHELCGTWCAVDGRPVEIIVWCPWRTPPPSPPPSPPALPPPPVVREIEVAEGLIDTVWDLSPPSMLPLHRPHVTTGSFVRRTPAPPPTPLSDAASVLGARRCLHASAEWRVIEEGAKERGWQLFLAALDCPECLRPALAVCWLHHFPDTHPVWSAEMLRFERSTPTSTARWEEGYMRLWRATEVRNGRPDTVRTFAELRASDPPVPIDPSAYADRPQATRHGPDRIPPPRRPLG